MAELLQGLLKPLNYEFVRLGRTICGLSMHVEHVSALLITCVLVLLLVIDVRRPSARSLDRPQVRQRGHRGPKSYPLVGSQFELMRNLHRVYDWTTSYILKDPTNTIRTRRLFSKKHVVATANPFNVEHILKTNFENYPKGESINHSLKPLLGEGIFNSDGEAWRSQRKVSSHEFSTRTIRDFVVRLVHDEIYTRLFPVLAKASIEGTEVDIQDVLNRFGFDNICLLGFGVDVGCLHPSFPEVQFATAFDNASRLSFRRLLLPKSLLLVWDLLGAFGVGPGRELKRNLAVIDKFALDIIRLRRKELQLKADHPSLEALNSSKFSMGYSDLLSRFIQLNEEMTYNEDGTCSRKDASADSDRYLRDIILNFIVAGRDTSSIALCLLFWLLNRHPEVEEKMRTEVMSIVHAKGGRVDHECFSYDDLREMNYVQAAITESMRLYPPVPRDSKSAREDDYLPDGTFIQKGDRVVYHPYAMGRNEAIWGKDCLEFKPERFLQEGKFVPESSFKYPVFQAGPRICLGKEMAYTQMKYIVAALLISPYRFKLPQTELKFAPSLNMKLAKGLKASVVKISS